MAHTVALRSEIFARTAQLAGYHSSYSLARAMDLNRSTISRALSGDINIGAHFIGSSLHALAPMSFEVLFEVVPVRLNSPSQHPSAEFPPSATGWE
ncbi:transcriptional regulator [Actinosynnema pretiosum]|uniref:Transcriptional regulator n=1 Tax=Actinosynnema pretiosum TaxID=42197 RepID=A0A290Z9M7_9PSEU|nr:transcriptional regulator [Actinosynnema pretiosum]